MHFFLFSEAYLLQNKLFSHLVAFLVCSILFNTSLFFPEFVKMDVMYLYISELLPSISVLCSSFKFCMALPAFKYSDFRLRTCKHHLWYSSLTFCHLFCITFILCSNSLIVIRDDVLFRSLMAVPYFCTSCSNDTVHFLSKSWIGLVIIYIPVVILQFL